jgi:NPCBM/NEW2 domain
VIALIIGAGSAIRSCQGGPQSSSANASPAQSSVSSAGAGSTPSAAQTTPAPVTSKSSQVLTVTYLSDLTPVAGNAQPIDTNGTNVTISGVDYTHSVPIFCSNGRVNDLEYNLGNRAKRFMGVAGIGDTEDASGLSALVSFYGDGHLIETVHVRLAQPNAVKLSVSGVLRLRIAAQLVQSASDARSITVSVGNARFTS